MDIILSVLEQGFIYGLAALGATISYRILNFPDLSVEGTFPLGAAITAGLVLMGVNPFVACVIAMFFGALAGMVTGFIHVMLKVTDLQSGIIMLTSLYSVNLAMNGRANVPFFNSNTIFSISLPSFLPQGFSKVLVSGIVFFAVKFCLDWYLKTKSGLLLRATGDNSQFVVMLGKNPGNMKIIGLAIANALAALSGSIISQYQRFSDVSMGAGVIVIALSSVIIGASVCKQLSFLKATTMALIGCFLFQGAYALAIFSGIDSTYMRLLTAALFLISLLISRGGFQKRVGRSVC